MRINKEKCIGRVLFIVEGGRYEFSLLSQIFCNIFSYDYIEKRRNKPDWFVARNDPYSMIAVINTKESNIKDITENDDYLDELFGVLLDEYGFPVDQSAIYYLFDRDPKSNKSVDRIRYYIQTLKNPYDNEYGMRAGQLLLSYPSIESYTISGFRENTSELEFKLGSEAKTYIGENTDIQRNKISEDKLLNATKEFAKYIQECGLKLNIDDFSEESMYIFEEQEKRYEEGIGFRLFSMLTLAFLQMGIIEI